MNGRIDVLEVMRRLASASHDPDGGPEFADVEAHAAIGVVAELIEAAEGYAYGEYHDIEMESVSDYRSRRRKERYRLEAALDRVNGGG